jgi:quercetin dioxygenase-like cupin family protein
MTQTEFEADLRREGYQISYGGHKPGTVNAEHAHEWDTRIMVAGGEITVSRGGRAESLHAGQSCMVPAGELHAEHIGPEGVALVIGRRPRPA